MTGKKNRCGRAEHVDQDEMRIYRVRFFLGQNWSEEDIAAEMHISIDKVRALIYTAQLREGTYELV